MVTCTTFYGIIGIQNASPYMLDSQGFWRYDNSIGTPDGDVTLPSPFCFPVEYRFAEDGIYLIVSWAGPASLDGHSGDNGICSEGSR
jgi:hypothetical protein